MDITRRIFVSGAIGVPFLGKVATAQADNGSAAVSPTFTVLEGLTELRMTDPALTRLREVGVELYAVDPAEQLVDADGNVVGVRLLAEYGRLSVEPTGRPATAVGRALGGVGLRGDGSMEITGLRGDASDGLVFAFLRTGDEWRGELPLYRIDLDEVRLVTELGLPGRPTRITGGQIPLRPTQEGLDAFADTFGTSVFTPDEVVATCRVEGLCWPLPEL